MTRHGENIRKRKDGRWEARYIKKYDQNGKAIYKSVYGPTYQDVKTKRSDEMSSSDPDHLRSDLTFTQVAELWLKSKKDILKASSYNQYYNQCHKHLIPELTNMKFSQITSADINGLLKKKLSEGYTSSSVTCYRTILLMIFHYARRNNIKCSVKDDILSPKSGQNQVIAFTRAEQNKTNEYLSEHPDVFNLAVYLSMYCGLRIGEVCALQWKDIQLNKEVLTVSKTLIRIQNRDNSGKQKTEIILQKPKTESSIRTIPIPSFLVPLLKKYKEEDEFFVITGKAQYMEPRVCLRKFKNLIHKIGISDYTFHACRHTFATRCVEVGMDPKTLSELLGHFSVKTTLDRYVHPSIDLKRDQINKLSEIASVKNR